MSLPFDLPRLSRGYAALTPHARDVGRRVGAEAARALGALFGGAVTLTGRPLPALPSPGVGCALLHLELSALAQPAALEVDASLAASLLDLLAGGTGKAGPATEVTPLERAALELALLACLDAAASVEPVEARLAPRLVRARSEPLRGLQVELSIRIGDGAGRARLILPHAAVASLGASPGEAAGAGAASEVVVDLSLRRGTARLTRDELAGLEPGDVVLLDPSDPRRLKAVAPGGLGVLGIETDGALHVEEVCMPEPLSGYPLPLEVELARVPITLSELARLEPGAVLPLPIDRRGLVTLKLGDRAFARGELVDVEGTLGVRIDAIAEGP
jgi:type III secretion protein Q